MKTKNKIIFLILFLSLFFGFSAKAEIKTVSEELSGITINRIAPDRTYLNQKIWITLFFENNSSASKIITLKENLGNADFDKTEAKNIATEYGDEFWYYEWKIQLGAGENISVSYWLIPQKIGSYTISPSKITIDGKNYSLGSWNIEIKCLADEKCDPAAGENYLNCPYDCPTGSSDNLCDQTQDGNCDLDCEKGADPDCGKSSKTSNIFYPIAIGIVVIFAIAIILKKIILRKKIT
jgi:hypothetical protein